MRYTDIGMIFLSRIFQGKPNDNMNSQFSAPLLIKSLYNQACHAFQKFGFCTIRLWKFSYLDREDKNTKT